jgi:hypothetical protein
MKRTPLKRTGNALARSKPLARGKGLLGRKRRQKPVLAIPIRVVAFDRTDGWCADGCGRRAQDPHHILPRQKWPELINVAANVIGVHRVCHEAHENASKRLPRSVCAPVEALELTGAQVAYIERSYS